MHPHTYTPLPPPMTNIVIITMATSTWNHGQKRFAIHSFCFPFLLPISPLPSPPFDTFDSLHKKETTTTTTKYSKRFQNDSKYKNKK